MSLHWDSDTDVDLYVQDPQGELVFFGNRAAASQGALDLDAHAGCGGPGQVNENVYWPAGAAPPGQYHVWADLWSSCAHEGETTVRITLLLGEPSPTIDVYTVTLSPEDVMEKPYSEDDPIFSFTWPGSSSPEQAE